MFDFCSQFARQVEDAALSFYFHLLRLLLYLRQGRIVDAKAYLATMPKAPKESNPFWSLYAAFMTFRLQCYYDPNQGLALAAKQMARWPPYLASPDSAAYLTVDSQPKAAPGRSAPAARQVFRGWMFASSPGLNPLQHPVYDAWLISCRASAPVPAKR